MDGLLSLLGPVLESHNKEEALKNFLSSCADQRTFSQGHSGIPSLVGVINAKLNEPSSRLHGLLLLQALLPQCTEDVLSMNANSWMQFCLKGLSVSNTSPLSFQVLKMLLVVSKKLPELTKNVNSNVIPNLAEQVHDGILPQSYIVALECLEVCLKMYNGSCGPHKKIFERLLLSLIDYTGPQRLQVVWQAALCMGLLPQIGGGGTGGALHKCAWATQHRSLCRTLHLILDSLYSEVSELQVGLVGGMLEGVESIPLTPLEDGDPVLLFQKLTTRLISVSAYLQGMLVQGFPVPKNISVSSILNVICRGLAVTGNSVGNTTIHSLALTAELPKIHYSLLKLLESLILSCRTNLLPFAGTICKLAIQTLKWIHVDKWAYGTDKPFRFLRTQAYEIIIVWCGVAKCGSLIEDVADQLVELALPDIYSERGSVLLSAALSKKNKYANRKQLKGKMKANQEFGNDSSSSRNLSASSACMNVKANEDVCVSALRALQGLLASAWFKIQPSLHKTLQETVVTILLQITCQREEPVIPYSERAPRLGLYRLLLQLVLDNHPVWPAPTSMALQLFAKGLNDRDAEISMFCTSAQSSVEKIIHPAFVSMQIPASCSDSDICITDQSSSQLALPSIACDTDSCEDNSDMITNRLSDANPTTNFKRLSLNETSEILVPETPEISSNSTSQKGMVVPPTPQTNEPTTSNFLPLKRDVIPTVHSNLFMNFGKSTNSSTEKQTEVVHHTAEVHSPSKIVSENESSRDQLNLTNDLIKSPHSISDLKNKTDENHVDKPSNEENATVEEAKLDKVEESDAINSSQISANITYDDEMIDLAQSDKSDEICEVDIAESEDDNNSGISICSQVTLNSPHTLKGTEQKNETEVSPVTQARPDSSNIKLESYISPQKKACVNGSAILSNGTKETEGPSTEEDPKPCPRTPSPRLLRSRTISNSSRGTPSKKSKENPVTLEPALEEEESAPVSKRQKLSRVVDAFYEDYDLDEAAMVSSFIDVTQGD